MAQTYYGINGNMFNVIQNMYNKAKSCLKQDNMLSDYFHAALSYNNLSPLLFAMFVNDFRTTCWTKNVKDVI